MPDANPNFVNERYVADDKFGKTRIHDGPQNPSTQYDIKKIKADLKKITSSENQYTLIGGIGIHSPNFFYKELINVKKLSLPVNAAVGSLVDVSDGFYVSGFGDARDGFYAAHGSAGGKTRYDIALNDDVGDGPSRVVYDGTQWTHVDYLASTTPAEAGNEDYPWQAVFPPLTLTLTHPAHQQLAAPGVDAMVVNGVAGYTARGTYDDSGVDPRPYYNLIGTPDNIPSAIYWKSSALQWKVDPIAGGTTTSADVATPDLATWTGITVTHEPAFSPQGGIFVSGGTQDGVWTKRGTSNGKDYFNFLGEPDDIGTGVIIWSSNIFVDYVVGPSAAGWMQFFGGVPLYYSLSDVSEPSLAGTDKVVMAYNGVAYSQRGTSNGKPYYTKIGELASTSLNCIVLVGTGEPNFWKVTNNVGGLIDSADGAPVTPDLATGYTNQVTNVSWLNAADDTPASITVSSLSVGDLAAGFKIDTVTYQLNGNLNGRGKYSDVLGVELDIYWDGSWNNGAADINFANLPFPWQGTPEVSITKSDVAAEANWV